MVTEIFIADDHPLFREALRTVIDRIMPEAVYREVASYRELQAHTINNERFDAIFVDLTMPGGDAFDVKNHLEAVVASRVRRL